MNNQFIFNDLNESMQSAHTWDNTSGSNISLDSHLLGPLPNNNVTPAGSSTTTGSENWTSWNAFDYPSSAPHNRQAPFRQRQENVIPQQVGEFPNINAGPINPTTSSQSYPLYLRQENQPHQGEWLEQFGQPFEHNHMPPSQQEVNRNSSQPYPLFLPQENQPHQEQQNEVNHQFQRSALRSQNDWSHAFPNPHYPPLQQASGMIGPSRSQTWNQASFEQQHVYPSTSQAMDLSANASHSTTFCPQQHPIADQRRMGAPPRFHPYLPQPPPTASYRIIRGPPPDSAFSQPEGHQAGGSRVAPQSLSVKPPAKSRKRKTKAATRGSMPRPRARNNRNRKQRNPMRPIQCALPHRYGIPADPENGDAEVDDSKEDDSVLCCQVFPNSVSLMSHIEHYHRVQNQKNIKGKMPCPWVSCDWNVKTMLTGSIYRHISEVHADLSRDTKPKKNEEEEIYISYLPPTMS